MAAEMAARGRNALVFRGSDGLDELTTTGNSEIWLVQGGEVREFTLNPVDLGLDTADLAQLVGADAHHNADVAKKLLAGERSGNFAAIRDVVALNAAGGVVAYSLGANQIETQADLNAAFAPALQKTYAAIDSGDAAQKLSDWMAASQA
jgi:anthranilate phosphoribosyltransferase